jgi:hypothetical protein
MLNLNKLYVLMIPLLLHSPLSDASTSYMSSSPSLVLQAIQIEYGPGSGIGTKEGRCVLCHNSEAGGAGNLNPYFGMDFNQAAIGRFGRGGGLSLIQLQEVFSLASFAEKDSDGDGVPNEEEFMNNNDPSKNVAGAGSAGGAGGGGCGMVAPLNSSSGPKGPGAGLLFLPFFLLLWLQTLRTRRAVTP